MSKLERYVGEVLDEKYRLERLLGRGGMGAVYLATHLGTERYVALKLISPQFMSNEEFVERFKREARAAGRLRHPNVVDVTDFGFAHVGTERVAYLVMEYLDGCTLGDVLAEEKRLPVEWSVDILEQVCSAVHEAHLQGVVHRDLKPDNIWLEPNRLGGYQIKVLDFGIAKLAETDGPANLPAAPETSRQLTVASLFSTTMNSAGVLETDTLIYDSKPDPQLDESDELATQQFFVASHGTGGDATAVQLAEDSNLTQRLDLSDRPDSTGSNGAAAETLKDQDQTLMFDANTSAGQSKHLTETAPDTFLSTGLTRVGAIMGTPHYMSPEQCRSAHLDARSDIYSLGVIAYQMLAGDLPFKGNTASVISSHLETAPPILREHNRKVPRRVSSVVMSAMAKDPAARPQTAAAFANSLRAQAEGIGALYRRAFALYSEYLPKFLKLSIIAHIPVIITTFAMIGFQIAEKAQPRGITPVKIILFGCLLLTGLLQIAAYTVAASTIAGVTAVIVTQLQAAPMRPVELRLAFSVLRKRLKPFIKTIAFVTLKIILGFILGIIPGIVISIRYALHSPVVLLEGLEMRAALKRARALASRSWRTVITISLLQFLIPMIVSILVGRVSINLHRVTGQSETRIYVQQIYQQLSGLINIAVVPLMSIVSALLYLKMRRFGGESLGGTLEQIESADMGRTEWQQRMRSRLTNPTTHVSGQRSGGSSPGTSKS
ncbi:MAG TPA: serine/threonine-protein kinase [Pyrinomonadaceae bacterium]|jgi:serine/threonine protein kinase|nr:serine/threonine-protein kinase [Pyrinomonadaceae bacterium]